MRGSQASLLAASARLALNTLKRRANRSTFDLAVLEPRETLLSRRIQRFAGVVRSASSIPTLSFKLNGIAQHASQYDLPEDPKAAQALYQVGWAFHLELDTLCGKRASLVLEVFAGEHRLERRVFHRGCFDDRSSRPLVFMPHIPKTAGTSLRAALEQQPSLRLLSLYYDRAYITPAEAACLSPAALDDVDVIFGHFQYGQHRQVRRRYEYITMLRDPAEAMKSYYLFHKYLLLSEEYKSFGSLEQAVVASSNPTYDNGMTRYLCGRMSPDPVSADDLAVALVNMEKAFVYIGTVECMQASLDRIASHLGLQLANNSCNVTPQSLEGDAFDTAAFTKQFAPRLEYDFRLYDHALKLFASGPRIR